MENIIVLNSLILLINSLNSKNRNYEELNCKIKNTSKNISYIGLSQKNGFINILLININI